jgi:beta-galactosidase
MKQHFLLLLAIVCVSLIPQSIAAQKGEIVVTPYSTTLIADGATTARIRITLTDKQGIQLNDSVSLVECYIDPGMKIIAAKTKRPSDPGAERSSDGIWKVNVYNGEANLTVQAGTEPGMYHFEARSMGFAKGETDFITVSPEKDALVSIDEKYILSGDAKKLRPIDMMLGADISFLPELEARGVVFTEFGIEGDAIQILKKHGFNYIRLRIFNDPANENGYSPGKGFCDLAHTKAMAKRVKAAGMKLLLDFHYSDTWADPGKQYKPKAWEGLAFPQLKQALYDYTAMVISELQAQGTPPDMVQVGNEINHGIVWPDGNVANPNDMAQLYNAGVAAVKSVDVRIPVMLHIALGGQNQESDKFIEGMVRRGAHFDVIGQSYYPKWHGTLDDLKYNLDYLSNKYQRDIIVVEYSHLKNEVNKIAFNVANGRGKGTCIWEPLSTWESVFDKNGAANKWLAVYDDINKQFVMRKRE